MVYRVGVLLRIDVLSPGARKGLWDLAYPIFKHFGTLYNVLAGGWISNKDFGKRLKAALEKERAIRSRDETVAEMVARVTEQVKNDVAREIAEEFPRLTGENGESIKTYIVTAPALNYDHIVGAEIANLVSGLRNDIVFWGEEDQRFVVKGLRRENGTDVQFHVILPVKGAWRSKYYSTRPQRLIEDKEMQSAQRPPELWVADCAAVGLVLPAAGDREVPIFSFPGLHRLQRVTTSENQVGVGIIELADNGSQPKAWFVSLKDLMEAERSFIPVPEAASDVQKKIIGQLKVQPSTVGMLESATGVDRQSINDALRDYEVAGFEPPILFDDLRKVKYDFDRLWMTKKLVYPELNLSELVLDVIAGCSCIHVGYCTTQYRWWLEDVPKLLLGHGVKTLAHCGDRLAGLKHNLHLRGAIIAGLNYTQQEVLDARLEGYVIFETFKPRFRAELESFKGRLNAARLAAMIDASLLDYRYNLGNHDKWLLEQGVTPLSTVIPELIRYLTEKITGYLRELKVGFPNFPYVEAIVRKHIAFGSVHVLPSGLRMGINHPEMARAQTASLRAQQVLRYQRSCQVCQFGNFHTAKAVLEWNWKLGERVAVENASILSGTEFEDGKLKTVDTAISFLRVCSQNGRIIMAQPFFEGPKAGQIVEYGVDELSELLPMLDLSWGALKKFPHN
jgi:hypothetical protein